MSGETDSAAMDAMNAHAEEALYAKHLESENQSLRAQLAEKEAEMGAWKSKYERAESERQFAQGRLDNQWNKNSQIQLECEAWKSEYKKCGIALISLNSMHSDAVSLVEEVMPKLIETLGESTRDAFLNPTHQKKGEK